MRQTSAPGAVHAVEIGTATIFAPLFAIGVVDLELQIVDGVLRGRITIPKTVVDSIDTGALLFVLGLGAVSLVERGGED